MRQRIIDNLSPARGDSDALTPVRREQFLVYLMGPYRTFDVDALLPADAEVETDTPSFATWDETTGEYAEDEVLRLLQETRDCLRDRGFNAFLAIDVGISLDEMDAATQSIAFAQASNATIFIAPQVGDNLGVGIEIGSVLEDLLSTAGMRGPAADATPPERTRRIMVATEPSVRSAMLGAVHARWDGSVRTFTDAADCCRLCAQFCTHIQNEEVYGSLDRLE
jgi:hypothetical protein